MTKNNTTEEMIHKFANSFALQLNPSNDTMEAVRLLRKELPALLAQALLQEREAHEKQMVLFRKHEIEDLARARLQERKDTLESVRGWIEKNEEYFETDPDEGMGEYAINKADILTHLTTLEANTTQDE